MIRYSERDLAGYLKEIVSDEEGKALAEQMGLEYVTCDLVTGVGLEIVLGKLLRVSIEFPLRPN